MKSRAGISLIEVIIVVALLVILTSIITPVIYSYIYDASEIADVANARLLYNGGSILLSKGGSGTFDIDEHTPLGPYISNNWPVPRNGKAFTVEVDSGTRTVTVMRDDEVFDPATTSFE